MQNWPDAQVSINQSSSPGFWIAKAQYGVHPKYQTFIISNTSLLTQLKVLVLLQDPPSYSTFIFPAVQLFSASSKLMCRFVKLLL